MGELSFCKEKRLLYNSVNYFFQMFLKWLPFLFNYVASNAVKHSSNKFVKKCSDYPCKAGLISISTDADICATLYLEQQKQTISVLWIFSEGDFSLFPEIRKYAKGSSQTKGTKATKLECTRICRGNRLIMLTSLKVVNLT